MPRGLRLMTVVVVFDFGWGEVVELAVETFFVEPRHPAGGRDLEVVESAPVAAVAGERGRVAVQLGLEQSDRSGLIDALNQTKFANCSSPTRRV
jgi:hypothetical protein